MTRPPSTSSISSTICTAAFYSFNLSNPDHEALFVMCRQAAAGMAAMLAEPCLCLMCMTLSLCQPKLLAPEPECLNCNCTESSIVPCWQGYCIMQMHSSETYPHTTWLLAKLPSCPLILAPTWWRTRAMTRQPSKPSCAPHLPHVPVHRMRDPPTAVQHSPVHAGHSLGPGDRHIVGLAPGPGGALHSPDLGPVGIAHKVGRGKGLHDVVFGRFAARHQHLPCLALQAVAGSLQMTDIAKGHGQQSSASRGLLSFEMSPARAGMGLQPAISALCTASISPTPESGLGCCHAR